MAQLVEHILGKDEVSSSNLDSSSKIDKLRLVDFLFSGHSPPKDPSDCAEPIKKAIAG